MYLVSACLAGIDCRYNGKNYLNEKVYELVKRGEAIPVCPEVLGGLTIPREKCEICNNNNSFKVISSNGNEYTKEFKLGAERTLQIAKLIGVNNAILKSKSPSCGCGRIYNGAFENILIEGNGITSQLLIDNGINVITENDIDKIK